MHSERCLRTPEVSLKALVSSNDKTNMVSMNSRMAFAAMVASH